MSKKRFPNRVRAGIISGALLAGLMAVGVGANVTTTDVSQRTGWSSFWRAVRAPRQPVQSPTPSGTLAASPSDSPTPDASQAPTDAASPSDSPVPDSSPTPAELSATPSTSVIVDSQPITTAATDTAEQQVLDQINAARAAAGVGPLTMSAPLVASAHAHNLTMAGGCGLSHQCAGGAALGARITAQGVTWSAAAENIGEGGPVDDTEAAQASMAIELTDDMLAETPPNDGHRRNILNAALHNIGVDVIRDADGTVWLTQDFTN